MNSIHVDVSALVNISQKNSIGAGKTSSDWAKAATVYVVALTGRYGIYTLYLPSGDRTGRDSRVGPEFYICPVISDSG